MENEKRLIYAYEAIELINGLESLPWEEETEELVNSLTTVDAVEVVRCKDCKYYNERNENCDHPALWTEYCSDFGLDMKPDDFCSYGERREGE